MCGRRGVPPAARRHRPPRREEAPLLARLWREYRSAVRFLGIDIEDSRAEARAFVRRYGLGYPHLFDAKAALAGKLGFFGLPTTYLVDGRGRVAAKLVGKQDEVTLRAALAAGGRGEPLQLAGGRPSAAA